MSLDSSGAQGDGDSEVGSISISGDGQVVAFDSDATNLVATDYNSATDVFVHDRSTGITERVSVDSSGNEGYWASWGPRISADGNTVAFMSAASNLIVNDSNGFRDIFVHDRSTGVTERVSVDSSGRESNNDSWYPAISADGRFVSFMSDATNLVAGDTNGAEDIFVHDRTTGLTERVSVDSSGNQADGFSDFSSISADGGTVAFSSDASNLVPGDTNFHEDVFVHDRSTGVTERVSVSSAGAQGRDWSLRPALTADGQVVAFESAASNLVTGDTNNSWDVFVHDRLTGVTDRVSVDSKGKQGNYYSGLSSVSADGQIVAFGSAASNLVPGDTNSRVDIFIHDRSNGITECASVDPSGGVGNGDCEQVALSDDGNVVAFGSYASNLVANDTNGFPDAFVRERCSFPASWSKYGSGFPGTNGVPSFTSQQNPVFGTTITLDLANSSAQPTVGLIFVGYQQTSLHSGWGGDLLVVPALTISTSFSYGSNSYSGSIPDDEQFCGVTIDLQAIEADPGAAKGVSFTAGLELTIGH